MIELFGWLAAAIGLISNVPQLVRILRAGTSAGVSIRLWQVTAGTTGAWASHGFLVQAPQMQWPNVFMSAAAVTIIFFVVRDRKLRLLPALFLPVVLGAALIGVELWQGAAVFGLVVAVPQLVGQFAQLRELIRAPEIGGVSLGFLMVFLVVQAMWFSFGFFTHDPALIVCAGAMTVVCTVNLVIYLIRRRPANAMAG